MDELQRRAFKRKNSLNLLDCTILNENERPVDHCMGRTLNLSEKGILLEVYYDFQPGHSIMITIALADELIQFKGKIIHKINDGDRYQYGIELKDIDEDGKMVLADFIKLLREN